MASALLRRRSAASSLVLPAARALLSYSCSAAATSSPATRAGPICRILQIRGGGEEMTRSATGGPVRRYHALLASASREAPPALRASRATLCTDPYGSPKTNKEVAQRVVASLKGSDRMYQPSKLESAVLANEALIIMVRRHMQKVFRLSAHVMVLTVCLMYCIHIHNNRKLLDPHNGGRDVTRLS